MGEKVNIDSIIEELDPKKMEKDTRKHKEARQKHEVKNVQIEDYDGIRKEVIGYMKDHDKYVKTKGKKDKNYVEMSEDKAFGDAVNILNASYKDKGGWQYAIKLAREGHMDEVIDTLAKGIESEEIDNRTENIWGKIDPTNFDLHVSLVDQYKQKYGHLLPDDMQQKSNEELAKDHRALINHHKNVVYSVREMLGKKPTKGQK